MSRILALDWGTARVGAAISDEEAKFAFPLEQPLESKTAITDIKKLVHELGIGLILIGLPKNLAGNEEKSAEKLKTFSDKLFRSVKVPISLIDERFSTVHAEKILKDQGMPQRQQRGIKDNIAAQIILQQYLDKKN